MPDSAGRYTLTEMEDRVRRLLDAVNFDVDPNTGAESGTTIVNQQVSNTSIDQEINSALVGLYTEAILGHEDLFAMDVYMDIQPNQIDYTFPLNMFQLRYMRWKDPGLLPQNTWPTDYIPMIEIADPLDVNDMTWRFAAPTWRRNGDGFSLNEIPQQLNQRGILLNIIALPPELVESPPNNVIRGLYARLAQFVVIYDAANNLAATRNEHLPEYLNNERTTWHQRFMSSVENAQHAVSVSLVTNRMPRGTYSGRRQSWQ